MKKAFTMLELIMVIVIIGILAAVIIPRTGSNKTAEAAVKLISDIRYTQHLAMIDDKYGQNNNWYRDLWQIRFNGNSYSIISDNGTRPAKDPITKEDINVNLIGDFGVQIVEFGGNCGADETLSFDHMGRPIVGDLSAHNTVTDLNLTTINCNIHLSDGSEDVNITIEEETGYAKIIP